MQLRNIECKADVPTEHGARFLYEGARYQNMREPEYLPVYEEKLYKSGTSCSLLGVSYTVLNKLYVERFILQCVCPVPIATERKRA